MISSVSMLMFIHQKLEKSNGKGAKIKTGEIPPFVKNHLEKYFIVEETQKGYTRFLMKGGE